MPLPFFAFHDHVAGLLGISTRGFALSTTYNQGTEPVVANASFATNEPCNATVLLKGVTTKSGIRVGAKIAASTKDVQPSAVFEQAPHTVEVSPLEGAVSYTFAQPAVLATVKSLFLDGLSSTVQISSALTPEYSAGVLFDYDPSRSGLKSYSYGAVATNPSWLKKAIVSATVSSPNLLSLGLSYSVAPQYRLLLQINRSSEVKLGGAYTSPCGAAVAAFVDPIEYKLGLTAKRRVGQWWTMAVGISSDLRANGKPSFGITFTDE